MGRRECGAGSEARLLINARELVPGADRKAIIAAIDAVAHERAKRRVDVSFVLDREIGDAAPRVQAIGRGKGARGTNLEAARALTAMIALGRVGRKVQRQI